MGLFSRKKKASPEEENAKLHNLDLLDQFHVTKAWGVKKYPSAMQFIYDEEARRFVVVEGPEDTFEDREPWVIDFDQVTGVALEVEENWTETKGDYVPNGHGMLPMERYDEVWWKYDFYIIIRTTHPYAGDIRFQTNFKPNFVRVPNKNGIFVRRGLELNGRYEGEALKAAVAKMKAMTEEEPKAISFKKKVDLLTGNRPDGIVDRLKENYTAEQYLKTLDNILKHVKRADRISDLLLK